MVRQFVIKIGEDNTERLEVSPDFNFSIGEVIRLNEDDDDWVVEKVVTIIDKMERLVFCVF